MVVNTYDKFCNAINNNQVNDAESIFASSDVRCGLISNSLKDYDRDTIVFLVQSFQSKGLREQALNICNNCSMQNCNIKQEMFKNQNIKYYSNDENKLLNKKNYLGQVIDNKMFDIHSGEYIN